MTMKKSSAARVRSPIPAGRAIALTAMYAALILWALSTVLPFLWVLMNAFKDRGLILGDSFSLPTPPTLENFQTAFDTLNIARAYANSFLISGSVTLVVMLCASFAAFGLTRYAFRGRGALQALVMASLMFPAFSTILPVFRIVKGLGLLNRLPGAALPQIAGNLPFAIVILMGYIRSLPIDLEEAAFLEGCGPVGVFRRVVLPLMKPALATVAIFTFLWSYNDLFTQLFFLRKPEVRAINRLLNEITSQYGTDYGLMAASVVIVVLPVLAVYVLLQKNIIKGLTAGAVKG